MSYIILESIDIQSLINAQQQLKNALNLAKTELEQVGTIQRFECCYELAWKTMKRILAYQGKEVNSPRTAFREAQAEGLIECAETWFLFLQWRNNSVRTYDNNILHEIFDNLPIFDLELTSFVNHIKLLRK